MKATANITYGGFDDKGLTVKVKDTSNIKDHWVLWKKDYDNKELDSEAYTALLGIKPGETFGVTYGEKDKSFVGREGNTITYKEKTIYSILPPVANPTPAIPNNPPYNAPAASQGNPKDEKFWEKQAYEKCCSLWLGSIMSKAGNLTVDAALLDSFWKHFQAIRADAKKRFFEFSKEALAEDDLPTIQVNEDVNVDDIPF